MDAPTSVARKRRVPKAGWLRLAIGRAVMGLGIVLAAMWLVSGWFDIYTLQNERATPIGTWLIGIRFGGIDINRYAGRQDPGWTFERRNDAFRNGWFCYATFTAFDGSTERWISAPLWPLAAGTLLAGFGLTRWARHAELRRRGRCVYCGYDLRGIASGARCPECGEGTEKDATA